LPLKNAVELSVSEHIQGGCNGNLTIAVELYHNIPKFSKSHLLIRITTHDGYGADFLRKFARGVDQDFTRAVELYRKAAGQGHAGRKFQKVSSLWGGYD